MSLGMALITIGFYFVFILVSYGVGRRSSVDAAKREVKHIIDHREQLHIDLLSIRERQKAYDATDKEKYDKGYDKGYDAGYEAGWEEAVEDNF